jgi:hypothetical protein
MVVVVGVVFTKGLVLLLLVKVELEAVRPDVCQLPEMEYQVLLILAVLVAGVLPIIQTTEVLFHLAGLAGLDL